MAFYIDWLKTMHLRNFPHYYVKDGERVAVYYTADARDLTAMGWKREEAAKPQAPAEEPRAEAVESEEVDLELLTRVELLKYAADRGVDLPNNAVKAELIEACSKL